MAMSGAEADRLRVEAGITTETLWLGYMRRGGTLSCPQVEAFLTGQTELDATQYELLAAALHDRLSQFRPV